MIMLRNEFHNSEVRIRDLGKPTRNQYRRVRRMLCGMSDCKCGIVRGPQTDRAREWWEEAQYHDASNCW